MKEKILSTLVLVFPDFNKPFVLETDASKEGLGVVLSQKQDDGCYHPVAFGSRTLTPSKQNYHSSKLEFLVLKWSVTLHTDNNLLTYVLTTPNMDATGHCWVGVLASYEFTLEYRKRSDNAAADALSQVPVKHDKATVQLLLEGAVTSTTERGEALMSQPLQVEHDHLSEELQDHILKLASMHMTNWAEVQGEDVLLATCQKWMHTRKDVSLQREMHCLEDAWANIQTQKRVRHCFMSGIASP